MCDLEEVIQCAPVSRCKTVFRRVSLKVFRALCNARIGRAACLSGSRTGWHLKAFITTSVYNPPVKTDETFSSWDSSGTAPGAVWLLLLSHLRSWTKIQVLVSRAVTLIPKPAAEQVWWLPTCVGKWEVYPIGLSFSMLPASRGPIWKPLRLCLELACLHPKTLSFLHLWFCMACWRCGLLECR